MGNFVEKIKNIFKTGDDNHKKHESMYESMEVKELQKQIECLKKINEDRKIEMAQLVKKINKNKCVASNDDNDGTNNEQNFDVMVSMSQIEHVVDEMLADDNINISYLPDFVEKQLYLNIIRIIMNIIAKTSQTTKIEFLGHELSIKLSKKLEVEDELVDVEF